MANYIKATNFTAKDALPSGNAGKIIKGTEIDVEYTAIATAIASKADTNSPTFTGTPLAPTAAAGTNNTQIATTAFVAAFSAIPAGGIIMWSGSIASIPSGWALCNGSNGTPDLRDRFVVGAGSSYSVAATGGSKDAIVVSHSHTASSSVTDPGHSHALQRLNNTNTGSGINTPVASGGNLLNTNSATTGISVSTTVNSAGSSGTNANLPPYYALAYIQKL
jgi:microcystin-dependent protein